jgi:plastocyanin
MRASGATALSLTASALALAGCGSDEGDGGGETKSPGKSIATIRLSATDFKFAPDNPRVPRAGKVTFVTSNDGRAPHALEVEGPGGDTQTGNFGSGETERLEVDLSRPGTYEFNCPVDNHAQLGMDGEVTVGGG